MTTFDIVYLGPTEALAEELESTDFISRVREHLSKRTSLAVVSVGFGTVEVVLGTGG